MSLCVSIPQCVRLGPRLIRGHLTVLQVKVKNSCDYDVVAHLYVKNRRGQVLHEVSVELGAYEERCLELVLESQDVASVTGTWGLRGTTLRLPIDEVRVASDEA